MSAMRGTRARFRISRSAAAAARSGTARRTISAPALSSRRTWAAVARTSRVSVLVMAWTTTGASPPMTTPPTLTGRVFRRRNIRSSPALEGHQAAPAVGQPLDDVVEDDEDDQDDEDDETDRHPDLAGLGPEAAADERL